MAALPKSQLAVLSDATLVISEARRFAAADIQRIPEDAHAGDEVAA